MKKKEILAAIGLTATLSITGCASNEITQTKTETTVELGSECTIIPTDYFELGSKVNPDTITVDTSSVDTNTIGAYVAVITYKDNTYEIKVSVSDTTAPEITVKPDIEGVDRGTILTPADYVSVSDLSEVSVYFVAENGDNRSIEIPSDLDGSITEITYTVVAVDTAGNRSEELTITVPINEISLEIDAAGVDGTTEEGEYDEVTDNQDTELQPATQEEIDAAVDEVVKELLEEYGNPTPSHIEGNPVEGVTPSTGELPHSGWTPDQTDTTGIEGVTLE